MEYVPPVPCTLSIDEQLRWGHEHGYMAECNDAMAKMYGRPSAKRIDSASRSRNFLCSKILCRADSWRNSSTRISDHGPGIT